MINMSDTLEVTRSAGFFSPNVNVVRIRHRHGLVYMMVDDKVLEMHTPAAHKAGFALVVNGADAMKYGNEFVVMKVNGVALNFPPKSAKQIGAKLLLRADDADDFQKRINQNDWSTLYGGDRCSGTDKRLNPC